MPKTRRRWADSARTGSGAMGLHAPGPLLRQLKPRSLRRGKARLQLLRAARCPSICSHARAAARACAQRCALAFCATCALCAGLCDDHTAWWWKVQVGISRTSSVQFARAHWIVSRPRFITLRARPAAWAILEAACTPALAGVARASTRGPLSPRP